VLTPDPRYVVEGLNVRCRETEIRVECATTANARLLVKQLNMYNDHCERLRAERDLLRAEANLARKDIDDAEAAGEDVGSKPYWQARADVDAFDKEATP